MTPTLSFFTQTSDLSYTRHYYELHLENGQKQIWENYEELRNQWMTVKGSEMKWVEVKDVKKVKEKDNKRKGFGS
jgi:hypothetical protein